MRTSERAIVAALLAAALAACSSGGSTSTPAGPPPPPTVTSAALTIVGVGDSLTAGVQSNGVLGVDVAPNPIATSPFPIVQATQTHGFWALLWSQANGGADPSNPANSPLPLIASPGLGQILIPADTSGNLTSVTTACGSLNALAYAYATALKTRLNPQTTPLDVAVPGQTVHEALYMIAPETPCGVPPGAPLGGLAALVNSESNTMLPVLGNFAPNTTQVQAAAQLRGRIATVWLGSNDLLKFVLSVGRIVPTDPAQLGADMAQIIQTLQGSGAKVAVANLVDVLGSAFFVPQPALGGLIQQRLAPAVGAATAAALAQQTIGQLQAGYGIGANGYVTLSGVAKIFAAIQARTTPVLGGGDFVPDALAAQVQALNTAYNAAIAGAARQTGAALVDVHATFVAAKAGVPINPPKCCSLQLGGGLTSLDGIHPSNTGYALIANAFIAAINRAYGTTIPPVNVAAVYAADIYAPH